jgi:hypothetical protein
MRRSLATHPRELYFDMRGARLTKSQCTVLTSYYSELRPDGDGAIAHGDWRPGGLKVPEISAIVDH